MHNKYGSEMENRMPHFGTFFLLLSSAVRDKVVAAGMTVAIFFIAVSLLVSTSAFVPHFVLGGCRKTTTIKAYAKLLPWWMR
jgi:hypothetical protein